MKRKTALWMVIIFVLAAMLSACGGKTETAKTEKAKTDEAKQAAEAATKEKEALEAGVEGVVYGLPLVIMDITKQKTINVTRPEAFAAPINQFANVPEFPTAAFKDVVRLNVDTLYSFAWLDLSKEPIVLSVPDTKGRYYLMPMLDAWTNVFASPGKRTTGTKAGHFAITGPSWSGTLPAGVQEIKAPTNMVWIIGRTQTNGPKDYAAVHAIQRGYKLVPLSSFGKPYLPPEGTVDPNIDTKTPPVEQLEKMNAATFFSTLVTLLKSNPPPPSEAPVLARLAKIGVVPGEKFDPGKLDPAIAKGLERSVSVALEKLRAAAKETGAPVSDWRIPPMILGNYGTDYGVRAAIALWGLGANLPADALYPSTNVDGDGKPLNGANRYMLHFDKGETPPVNAFWSITMYNADSFFVDHPINRYAISSWMPLKHNKDGSIDLFIQHESPGKDKEVNWLPAPADEFNLTMRMYWPKETPPSIIDGSWKPPAVTKVQ